MREPEYKFTSPSPNLFCLAGIYPTQLDFTLPNRDLPYPAGKSMAEPRRVTETLWYEKVRGFALCILALLSALFGSFYILMPTLLILFFDHHKWRNIIDRLVGYWLMLPSRTSADHNESPNLSGLAILLESALTHGSLVAIVVENFAQGKLIDNESESDRSGRVLSTLCLIISIFQNMALPSIAVTAASFYESLKSILKYLPGAGWAMSCNAYIFLKRSFDNDSERIASMLDYYANSGYNYQLLLFPEGTDKCEKATEKSRIYSAKKGLTHYAHVLHPKTTGFTFIVQKMREVGYIKHVYDVTIAFADSIVQSELDLLILGACPRSVHFDVRKLDIDSLPASDEDLNKWLIDLWKKKEDRLERFYAEERISERKLDTEPGAEVFELSDYTLAIQRKVAAFWIFITCIWLYIFFTYHFQYTIAFVTFVVFIGAQYKFGGIDWLAVKIAQSRRRKQT
ncbi:unnamed protein product [Anisakis simplex]|uniref:Lysocardiolipin acyltransferase 1 (inferred by orthology to a human protein) n=1 Tax=Anisakis simplex TaxID=6269 RepID=A0A0M3JT81_ANISI|nr:unnamed protein product [Anisakis simplex]